MRGIASSPARKPDLRADLRQRPLVLPQLRGHVLRLRLRPRAKLAYRAEGAPVLNAPLHADPDFTDSAR